MKNRTKIIISILLLLFLIVFCIFIFDKNLVFDKYIYNLVRSISNDFFDKYFVLVTRMGNTLTIFTVVLIFLLVVRNIYGVILTISTVVAVVSNTIIKQIFRRARPEHLKLIIQGGYSFPSGHSMISVCVYGYLLYFVYTKVKNKFLKILLSIFLIILILSIGISRIYVGVHYPTDVICGYLIAALEVILLIEFSNRGKKLDESCC